MIASVRVFDIYILLQELALTLQKEDSQVVMLP